MPYLWDTPNLRQNPYKVLSVSWKVLIIILKGDGHVSLRSSEAWESSAWSIFFPCPLKWFPGWTCSLHPNEISVEIFNVSDNFEAFFFLFFFLIFFGFREMAVIFPGCSLYRPPAPEGSCQFNFRCTDRQLTKVGALQQAGGQRLSTQLPPGYQPPYSSSCQGGTSPSCLASPHLLQLWLPESWSRVRTCKSKFLPPKKITVEVSTV